MISWHASTVLAKKKYCIPSVQAILPWDSLRTALIPFTSTQTRCLSLRGSFGQHSGGATSQEARVATHLMRQVSTVSLAKHSFSCVYPLKQLQPMIGWGNESQSRKSLLLTTATDAAATAAAAAGGALNAASRWPSITLENCFPLAFPFLRPRSTSLAGQFGADARSEKSKSFCMTTARMRFSAHGAFYQPFFLRVNNVQVAQWSSRWHIQQFGD